MWRWDSSVARGRVRSVAGAPLRTRQRRSDIVLILPRQRGTPRGDGSFSSAGRSTHHVHNGSWSTRFLPASPAHRSVLALARVYRTETPLGGFALPPTVPPWPLGFMAPGTARLVRITWGYSRTGGPSPLQVGTVVRLHTARQRSYSTTSECGRVPPSTVTPPRLPRMSCRRADSFIGRRSRQPVPLPRPRGPHGRRCCPLMGCLRRLPPLRSPDTTRRSLTMPPHPTQSPCPPRRLRERPALGNMHPRAWRGEAVARS